MAQSPPNIKDFTIAVLFAMSSERAPFRNMLDKEYKNTFPQKPGDNNHYRLGRIGPHDIVLATMGGEQGPSTATIAIKDLVRTFPSVRWRLLVGVGGGVPSSKHDIRLGDVVISMPDRQNPHGGVVQYDIGKSVDTEFRLKGFLAQPPRGLRNAVESMREDHERGDNNIDEFVKEMVKKYPRLGSKYDHPDPSTDILFEDGVPHRAGPNESCEACDLTKTIARKKRPDELPQVHYGLIASGGQVVADCAIRDELIKRVRGDVLCFEMEAAGLAADDVGCLVIRGISDYADPHKSHGWQPWAAANAAACAKQLLLLVSPEEIIESASDVKEKEGEGTISEDNLKGGDTKGYTGGQYMNGKGIQVGASGSFYSGRDVNIS